MRLFQRLAICGLIGLAAPFGVLALLSAQAKLDHQLELFVQGADNAPLQMVLPSPSISSSISTEVSAPNESAPMQAEEPAHVDRFSPPILPSAIDVIPAEGKKAVVVRVSNGLNGIDFARPDRWVDVLLTRQLETNSIFNDVIVQNARILAVDADAEHGARSVARSVTLEVDLVDAQKLLLASQVGFLSVVLSRPGDRPQDVRQVDIDDLTTTAGTAETHAEAPAATTPAAAAAPTPAVVSTPEAASAREAAPTPEAPPPSPEVASAADTAPAPGAAAPPPAAAVAAEAIEPAREEDDARFGWVTVRRPGAAPLVLRVPKE